MPWVYGSGSFALAQHPFVAAIGVTQLAANTVAVGRRVVLQTVLNPLFSVAVLTRSNINLNGKNVVVDSFNSTNPLYSVLGQYDPLRAMTNGGDIATDSSIVGDVNIGNASIYGHVYTGPGTVQSSVQVGAKGAIGDATWVNGGNSGIESNYWSGDFNMAVPDVPAPTFVGQGLPGITNGAYNLNGGTYATAGSLNAPLNITGPTVLWLQNSFSQGITIAATNNASLVLYIGTTNGSGDSVTIGGNGALNSPGYAKNLQIYGLPSLTSISLSGNAAFAGTIYAPEADMTGGGGGNNPTDTSGSIIVKSLTLNGHWNFHYDQSLKTAGPTRGWVPSAWTEQKYP